MNEKFVPLDLFSLGEEEVQEEVLPLVVEKPKQEEEQKAPGQLDWYRDALRGSGGCRRAPRR